MKTPTPARVDPPEFAERRGAIAALDAAARATDGHESLGDSVWRDLAHPGTDSVGFLLDDRAYVHVARAEGGDASGWTASIVRIAEARDDRTTTAMLEAAVAHVAEHGGGAVTCWIFGATDADDAAFGHSGFQPRGTLFEMRAPLPIAETPSWPSGVSVRTFEPGRDESEWLAVNNRAFAGHPDQGDWHDSTLRDRVAESWFDPALFFLAVDARGVAGFNWLKQHEARAPDPKLGEIYVIGVDPRAQGTGLGRALAIEGLHAVHQRGAVAGMLFCAADNTGAFALYRSLGFTVHRTDRAYLREVKPG